MRNAKSQPETERHMKITTINKNVIMNITTILARTSMVAALVALLLAIPLIIGASSFAQQEDEITAGQAAINTTTNIIIPEGAATQTVDPYYIPEIAQVPNGAQVTWINEDTAVHTSTSGSPTEGPSNQFDTGLINPGDSASVTITSAEGTTIPYYCTLHPWMLAALEIVPSTASADPGEEPEDEQGLIIPPLTGQEQPATNDSLAINGEQQGFAVQTEFQDATYEIAGLSPAGNNVTATSFEINPENNAIVVEFNGSGVVQLVIPREIMGNITAISPIGAEGENITFTELEAGIENATAIEFTVPQEVQAVSIIGTNVIPEFGTTIAIMALAVTIMGTIAMSRRFRISSV